MPNDCRSEAIRRLVAAAGLVIAAVLSAPAFAEEARAIDGDTIGIGATSIRLHGIDAPEMKQQCGDWPAGELAQEALAAMIIGRTVACEGRGRDRFGRTLASCKVDGFDLSAEMVRSGMALALVRYSRDYADLEAEAKAARRGMHGYSCEAPWEFRARVKADKVK
jgi:endonuclease YncB( thermonuclease family)